MNPLFKLETFCHAASFCNQRKLESVKPDNLTTQLANGWTADFTYLGEFRMSCEGWDMQLRGPKGQAIHYFQKRVVLVNDFDGQHARSCIRLSDDGKYGYLTDDLEGAWILDFAKCMFAPYRFYIHHHQGEKYISAFEQPAFKRAQEYVTIAGKLMYVTFPFCSDEDFPRIWEDYLHVRRRQLNELYFNTM
jgi:hypothetical protein